MKTAAIIAEYNPFHNGHKYQIEETKRLTGADYIVVLMSGNFVQRGAPAICNKYIRTQMALLGGADVVLELPSLYALSSAEFFAQGAISLLNNLNSIDFLSFGSECGNISVLTAYARSLAFPSQEWNTAITGLLKQGLSYPRARQQAHSLTTPQNNKFPAMELLSSPNNILGLEYCKALLASQSTITPVTIKRKGYDYHDTTLPENQLSYSSASAIRTALMKKTSGFDIHVPENICQLLTENNISEYGIHTDDFSLILHYKLLSEKEKGFADYLDCTPDISDKIIKQLPFYKGYDNFCMLLKSRDLTYTRISRVLLHILLNIKTPKCYKASFHERNMFVPYARLLGFRKHSSAVLSYLKKSSGIPIISNLPDAKNLLSSEGLCMLKSDIYTCEVYEAVSSVKSGREPLNEYKQSPVILSDYSSLTCNK